MDPIKEISGDWRADKWNLVAKTVNEARTDAKSCMNDLRGALRAFPSPAPVRSAVDMLELYQRILFNTMDAHEQTLASKEAELVRLKAATAELLAAYEAPYPKFEEGAVAQEAWSMRRENAVDAVRALTQPTE